MPSRKPLTMLALALSATATIVWLAPPQPPDLIDERSFPALNKDPNSSIISARTPSGDAPPTPVEKSQEAVNMVNRLGGTVLVANNGHVMAINLTGCELVRNDDLRHLATTPQLTLLNLDNTTVQDDGLRYIRELPQLRILRLCRTKITDGGLQHLENLPSLSTLFLDDTLVTDEGMNSLIKLPSLRRINVMGCSVTERAQQIIHARLPTCQIKR